MKILRNLGFGNVRSTRTLFLIAGIAIVAPMCIMFLFILGKLVGKAIFVTEKDGKGYNVAAKVLYISASALVGFSGAILIPFNFVFNRRVKISVYRKALSFANFLGISRFTRGMPLLVGVILLFISITCIVLICTKIPFYKNLKGKAPAEAPVTANASGKNVFSLLGIIFSAIGNLGTWITALVGILTWRKVYFYNGYGYTKVLCTLFLILMITGIVFLILGLAKLPAQKNGAKRIVFLIFSIFLLASSAIDSIWLILNAMRYLFKL
ncbi:MAG: hypothetical protein J5623_05850 [Clostridiales bacterium]|nr:hypothetical protein [Clostridiales bacterium]